MKQKVRYVPYKLPDPRAAKRLHAALGRELALAAQHAEGLPDTYEKVRKRLERATDALEKYMVAVEGLPPVTHEDAARLLESGIIVSPTVAP